MEYHLTIKQLPAEDRPRERLLRFGAQALSNAELVALLIRTGTGTETAIQVAYRLLKLGDDGDGGDARSLRYLVQASVDELKKVRGIGLAKAAQIKAAVELGKRLAATTGSRPAITSPADAVNMVMEEMRYLEREHFQVLMLNTRNQVLGVHLASVGTLNSSLVHPREIFREPIRRAAAAVILVHNHPSGDPSPSQEDMAITRRLVEAGRLLGIEVLDHIIIGDNRYISFQERGLQ